MIQEGQLQLLLSTICKSCGSQVPTLKFQLSSSPGRTRGWLLDPRQFLLLFSLLWSLADARGWLLDALMFLLFFSLLWSLADARGWLLDALMFLLLFSLLFSLADARGWLLDALMFLLLFSLWFSLADYIQVVWLICTGLGTRSVCDLGTCSISDHVCSQQHARRMHAHTKMGWRSPLCGACSGSPQ